MTIAQFFRVNGGSTQLRGVTPDISFPLTIDFDQNGEQHSTTHCRGRRSPRPLYARGEPGRGRADARGAPRARVAQEKEWQALQADIADYRKLRKDTTISLNEQVRRAERDRGKEEARTPSELAAANRHLVRVCRVGVRA
jgi:carboxyl-terminal processing protease